MDEPTLRRLIEILSSDPDIFVPLDRLWRTLREQALALDLDQAALQHELEGDPRFEVVPLGSTAAELLTDRAVEGPWVKLTARSVTSDQVLEGLARNVEQLGETLRKAWASRPEGDAEAEAILRTVMERTEHLTAEIQNVIRNLQPGEDEEP